MSTTKPVWTYNRALGVLKRNGRFYLYLLNGEYLVSLRKINILLAELNHSPAPSALSPIPKVRGAAKRKSAGHGAGEHLGGDVMQRAEIAEIVDSGAQKLPVIPSNPASRASTDTDEIMNCFQEGSIYVRPNKRNRRRLRKLSAWELSTATGPQIAVALDAMAKPKRGRKKRRRGE